MKDENSSSFLLAISDTKIIISLANSEMRTAEMENIQSNDKIYFNKTLILDFIATGLSVLFLLFLYVFGKVSGAVNWEMVIFDFVTGLASYWTILRFLKPRFKSNELFGTLLSIVLGSLIWALCHAGYIFYFDWRYLSDIRPETFYERNWEYVKYAFLYFTPIFSIFSLFFVFLLRLCKKIVVTINKTQ